MRGQTHINILLVVSLLASSIAFMSHCWGASKVGESISSPQVLAENTMKDILELDEFGIEANDIAEQINLWYALLLEHNQTIENHNPHRLSLNTLSLDSVRSVKLLFDRHVLAYPSGITAISIERTSLARNQQKIELKVTLNINTPTKSYSAHEDFEFLIEQKSAIFSSVNRSKQWLGRGDPTQSASKPWFSWLDFAIRYEIYKWVKEQNLYTPSDDGKQAQRLTRFNKVTHAVPTVLGRGDFLVRNIALIDSNETALSRSRVTVNVWLDWKGRSESGKYAVAAIKQKLTFLILNHKGRVEFLLVDVDQEFELPNVAPWEKLLC
ncbi:MAG: hypothetical protein GY928_36130 [Colwellia sp.]|nr:hypothetical protein [Colwellia sp.]